MFAPLMTSNLNVPYVALRTWLIFIKFELSQLICSRLVTFLPLIRYVTL